MKKIGIIGCGNMGEILVDAAIQIVGRRNVYCYDIDQKKIRSIIKDYKVNIASSNLDLVKIVDVVIISVKPQQFNEVLLEIKDGISESKLIVSIAAGIKIKHIENFLIEKAQIVRCMPNLPLKVAFGVTAMCKNNSCSDKNYEFVKKIFSQKGIVVEVKERMIDIITAISGSGPAYVFYLSEILQRVSNELGLPKKIISEVVNYTILGAAEMLTKQRISAKELRLAVTSKGGTTEEAIKVFKKYKLDKIFYNAVKKAYLRAKILSNMLCSSNN